MAVGRTQRHKVVGIRPYIAKRPLTLVTRQAGIDENNLVDGAVTVPVVLAVVNFRIVGEHLLGGLAELLSTHVHRVSVRIVVGLSLVGDCHGTVDIELQVEESTRLLTEIVGHTPGTYSFVVAALVEHPVIALLWILPRESGVGELHQNHHLLVYLAGIPLLLGLGKTSGDTAGNG